MKLNPLAEGDTACINFDADTALEAFAAAARERVPVLAARRLPAAEAAALVRQLGTAELLPELHDQGQALNTLYVLADVLAHADVASAWAGLADAPAALLGPGLEGAVVALPRGTRAALGAVAWLPLAGTGPAPALCWPDAALRRLHGPCALAVDEAAVPLLGLPQAHLQVCSGGALAAAVAAGCPTRPLPPGAWTRFMQAQAALLLGLISGASRRAVQEAYAYAKQRQSAGKPIAQHQAVALRLADLALNQQALSLYAEAAVAQGAAVGCTAGPQQINTAHVAELCMRIGRDAVQVAAAHGYVEGLPFKRLFEQLRTLVSVLSSVCGSPVTNAAQGAGSAALQPTH